MTTHYYAEGQQIIKRWNPFFICLSLLTSFVSSYAAVRLLDHAVWRTERETENAQKVFIKYPRIVAAFIFGFGGVWAMHFIGMSAITLEHVPACYDWVMAVCVSLSSAILFTWAGMEVASHDCFAGKNRLEVLRSILSTDRRVTDKKNRKRAKMAIHMTAFFHKPHFVIGGGVLTAVGALTMHYTGLFAMRGPFEQRFNYAFLVTSIVIAIAVCCIGFFIIFRVLLWKVEEFWLRPVSAAIISVAVNLLHYIGENAVEYYAVNAKEHTCKTYEVYLDQWTDLQHVVVFVAMATPCMALCVEHMICRELFNAYTNLKNPSMDSLFLVKLQVFCKETTTNRG